MTNPQFKIVIRRDPEDHTVWLVNVVGHPGAHTFGRSIAQARRHAIEMIALWADVEPASFDVEYDVRLGELAKPVNQARAAMAHAESDRQQRDAAVRTLTQAGMSYRDVAELLGLSHQRVAQITKVS